MSARYLGWALCPDDRAALLLRFPPAYPRVVADHVTLRYGVPAGAPLPIETEGVVVGLADDGTGVQALVVEINGGVTRPDGATYHVTWSLGAGRRPAESNALLRDRGWISTARQRLRLVPRLFG